MLRLGISLVLLLLPQLVQAGVMVAPGVHWRSFSFDQGETAITPNYYGIGGAINLGYSFAQAVDIGFYGDYTPATLTNVEPGKDDALLASYAGQLGFRFVESVYLGVRYGKQLYNVLTRREPEREVDGRWSGTFMGITLGALFAPTKQTWWRVGLDANRAELEREDQPGDSARKLDSFSVSLTFVFNNRPSGTSTLGGFIKSLGY